MALGVDDGQMSNDHFTGLLVDFVQPLSSDIESYHKDVHFDSVLYGLFFVR